MRISRKNLKKNKRNSKRISKYVISGGVRLNVDSYLEGVNITIDVEPTDTISDVKSKIIKQLGVDASKFYQLRHKDVLLYDSQKINDYKIPENGKLNFLRHSPGHKMSKEERDAEIDKHKYGLCCCCDNALDDRADFQVDARPNGHFTLMCNACAEYYTHP